MIQYFFTSYNIITKIIYIGGGGVFASFLKQTKQDVIFAYWIFGDVKVIQKEAKIKSSLSVPYHEYCTDTLSYKMIHYHTIQYDFKRYNILWYAIVWYDIVTCCAIVSCDTISYTSNIWSNIVSCHMIQFCV